MNNGHGRQMSVHRTGAPCKVVEVKSREMRNTAVAEGFEDWASQSYCAYSVNCCAIQVVIEYFL